MAEVVEVALALCAVGILHIAHIDEVRRTVFAGHSEASRDGVSTLHADRVEVAATRDEAVEMDLVIATTARAGGDDSLVGMKETGRRVSPFSLIARRRSSAGWAVSPESQVIVRCEAKFSPGVSVTRLTACSVV